MLLCDYYGGWRSPPEQGVTWQGGSPWEALAAFPERLPEYGPVNEDDQGIIDRHLWQAQAAGIDGFGACWYADEFLSYAAQRMAASKVTAPTGFYLCWDNSPRGDARKNTRAWMLAGAEKVKGYTSSPRYLKISDRPVVMLCATTGIDACIRAEKGAPATYTPTAAERGELLGAMKAAMGTVYLAVQIHSNDWINTPGIDALTFYNIRTGYFNGASRFARSYAEMTQGCEQAWAYWKAEAAKRGIAYWPTAMAGWDRKPWGGTAGDPLHDNCTPPNDAAITAHLRKALAQGPHTVLCAWNELGEGSFVQPSAGYPNRWAAVRAARS